MVARMVRDHEAASSSLATSTTRCKLQRQCALEYKGAIYTERYRSGHNGLDSKSGNGQPFVGSNPTRSANKNLKRTRAKRNVLGFLVLKDRMI